MTMKTRTLLLPLTLLASTAAVSGIPLTQPVLLEQQKPTETPSHAPRSELDVLQDIHRQLVLNHQALMRLQAAPQTCLSQEDTSSTKP